MKIDQYLKCLRQDHCIQQWQKSLAGNDRLRLLTTFGGVERIPLQDKCAKMTQSRRQKQFIMTQVLTQAYSTKRTREGIEASLKRDASYVWKICGTIINFYNLSVNNLFDFKGYQLEFSIIPITHYNHDKMMELFRRNSEYGVGKLELIVAFWNQTRAHSSES